MLLLAKCAEIMIMEIQVQLLHVSIISWGHVHDKLPTLHSLLGQQDMVMLFSAKKFMKLFKLG